jgi:glycosyltransferase involved in cell wall biosynthesis
LGLGDHVTIEPYIPHDHVVETYADARIFCLACRVTRSGDRDGLPIVLIEAAHAGCVCVSTDVSAVTELLVDGESGLVVPPDQPCQLAAALRRALEDDGLAACLSEHAVAQARAHHDVGGNVTALADAFATAARRETRRPAA